MRREDKGNFKIRIDDAEEFLESSEDNFNKERYKASLDHSIDAVIASNDAFVIFFLEQIPITDHREALSLHKEAGRKISENKVNDIALLLEERHRRTYRSSPVSRNLAEINLKKSKRFLEWVKSKILV